MYSWWNNDIHNKKDNEMISIKHNVAVTNKPPEKSLEQHHVKFIRELMILLRKHNVNIISENNNILSVDFAPLDSIKLNNANGNHIGIINSDNRVDQSFFI